MEYVMVMIKCGDDCFVTRAIVKEIIGSLSRACSWFEIVTVTSAHECGSFAKGSCC